jgi:biotin-(acetyl-CoA carboxylase) ligase
VIGDRTIEGRFADLAPDGALLLDTDEGRKRYVAGDVSLSAPGGGEA